MAIENGKLVNLQDAKVLYDDLRNRVGSVNESIGTVPTGETVEGQIAELEIGKAPAIEETVAEAPVVSISDAAANLPVKLTVGIDPVQDLHGFDFPWVGGAGKNLAPITVENIKAANTSQTWDGNVFADFGLTFIILTDNDGNVEGIKVNGTATENYGFYVFKNKTILAGSYKHNGNPLSESSIYIGLYKDGGYITNDTGSGKSVTFESDAVCSMRIRVGKNSVLDNVVFRPMLCLSTETDMSYAPYTNICPISGWTGCKVTRTGKNFVDVSLADWKSGYLINASGNEQSSSSYKYTQYYYRVKGAGTVTISYTSDGQRESYFTLIEYDTNKNFIARKTTGATVAAGYNKATVTLDEGTAFVRFNAPKTATITNLMLEYAPDATEYEPFGTTYNISFPGTVYGGELTVNKDGSGTLLVTYQYIKIDENSSNLIFNSDTGQLRKTGISIQNNNTLLHLCDQYTSYNGSFSTLPNKRFIASSSSLAVKDTNYTSLQAWKDHLEEVGGIEFCLRILSQYRPSYPLTPGQVKSLLGYNAMWADTGSIKSVDYCADTKAYIDSLFSSILPATGVSF